MTNIEIVKTALSKIKNVNNGVTLDMIFETINAGLETPVITRDQVGRAVRTIAKVDPLVLYIDTGLYRIKGRAVVEKPVDMSGIYPRYSKMDVGLNKREMKKLMIRNKRAHKAALIQEKLDSQKRSNTSLSIPA